MNTKNKILLTSFVVLTFGIYSLVKQYNSNNTVGLSTPTTVVTTSPTQSPQISTTTPATTPTQSQQSKYKDGSYTGSSADAFYGNVQVKTTIKNGKITNVQFLDYPKDRRTSTEISSRSTPILASEAIQTQSANVDIVSGATQTSQAFMQSLQSALDQAQS